jgi:hypothetical protein
MYSNFPHTASASTSHSSPDTSVKPTALGREGYSERIPKPSVSLRVVEKVLMKARIVEKGAVRAWVTGKMGVNTTLVKASNITNAISTAKLDGEIGEMPAVDSVDELVQIRAATGNAATGNAVTGNAATGNEVTGNGVNGYAVTKGAVTDSASMGNAGADGASVGNAGADLQMSPSENLDKGVDMLFSKTTSAVQTPKAAISATPLTASEQAMVDSIRNRLMNPQGLQFIGSAGLNWAGATANSSGSGRVKGTPLSGFDLGLSADIPLNKKWSFRPKAEYAYEGFRPDVNGTAVNIHVAYLSLPLDMVYHSDWVSRRFFVGAGPYLAHALSGTYTFKGIDTDMHFGNNYPNGDNLRSMDYGVHLMAGLLLDKNFVFGTQVNWGLSDIAPSGTGSDIHTRSGGLFLMYVFRK